MILDLHTKNEGSAKGWMERAANYIAASFVTPMCFLDTRLRIQSCQQRNNSGPCELCFRHCLQ
jgi:Zn-dependent peptidase ImmA (M78 family)